MRHILAGTTTTVLVEFMTHTIDTLNMQSKVLSGQTIFLYKFYFIQRFSQISSKFTGINAVVWGYTLGSVVYFLVYGKLKEAFNRNTEETQKASSFFYTLYSSFISSALAEVCALPLYYPYDLVKTRM
jgi:hypothetical protein